MTLASEKRPVSADTAAEVAKEFFDVYRRQDVNAMVDLCTDNADFSYVPFEMWRKQLVMRGDGKVSSVGKPMWAGLIHSFPDLTNEVLTVTADGDGNVAVEVVIGGTQAGPWGPINPRGQAYSEPHLFVLHVTDDTGAAKIDSITGYWDNASICRQLGHLEVD
jgi:ketosteroid isomerase-like protein